MRYHKSKCLTVGLFMCMFALRVCLFVCVRACLHLQCMFVVRV